MGARVGMRWNHVVSAFHVQRQYSLVLLAAALGIALSVVAFSLLLNFERHEIKEDFERTARDRALPLESSIAANVEGVPQPDSNR